MKSCQVCSLLVEDEIVDCADCGEASWTFSVDVAPAAKPKKAKTKATKAAPPVVEESVVAPVVDEPAALVTNDPVISDAEFAEELSKAADDELLALIGDARLPANWRALVDAEIAKRGDQ